jgi:hypothetical protein
MRTVLQRLSWVLCVLLVMTNAQARDSVLNAIPQDALGFAVVHNLTDASRSVDDLARLVQAPAPELLNLAKTKTGMQKGLDERGDAAIVLTSIDPRPKLVALAPVASFDEFFAALNVEEPAAGVVEVEIAGAPSLVGRKGGYAALASANDRDALEQFLASTSSLTSDAQLAVWLDANKASVVVTPRGIKQFLPKLTSGIRDIQAKLRAMDEANGQTAAAGLELYANLFAAAEAEVEQFSLALRVDSAQTVYLTKRVQFNPGGIWAKWAAKTEPLDGDLLAGFPAEPFIVAAAGAFPSGAMDGLMKLSVKLMQDQPGFQLTPQQVQKYVELSTGMMRQVRSMRIVLGLPKPGTGLYGNASVIMAVDDAARFLKDYEKALSGMSQLAQEAKNPVIPTATSKRIALGETEALEVTMDLSAMTAFWPSGGPDPKMIMQHMFGADGQLKVYLAPADEHAVLMTYTSIERLKATLDFYGAKQPGLSDDPGVAKVAGALPAGSQFVAYISLSGVADVVRQVATAFPGGKASAIPDLPDCPPIGIAAKVAPLGIEGGLVVTADTLRAIGNTVAKARVAAPGTSSPQQ